MKRLCSSATRPPGTMPATLSFAPIHSVVTPRPAPTKLGMTSTWMPPASAARAASRPISRSLAAPAATPAAATAAHAATAVEACARLLDLLCALLPGLARLVLPVEGLSRFARQALARLVARAGRARGLLLRPVGAALVHVGPALTFAAVLLPVAAVVAPVHVAVAPGIDVVVTRTLGEGRLADLRGLRAAPARPADVRALAAPAVVAVVDVDVGAVVADVYAAAAAIAAGVVPSAADREAEKNASGETRAPAVGRRRRVPVGADIDRVRIAGAVDHHAVGGHHRAVVARRVADEHRSGRA